jgi:hypothetical protein
MIKLGDNEPNSLQPNRHEPVPLEGKTVLVNGRQKNSERMAKQPKSRDRKPSTDPHG